MLQLFFALSPESLALVQGPQRLTGSHGHHLENQKYGEPATVGQATVTIDSSASHLHASSPEQEHSHDTFKLSYLSVGTSTSTGPLSGLMRSATGLTEDAMQQRHVSGVTEALLGTAAGVTQDVQQVQQQEPLSFDQSNMLLNSHGDSSRLETATGLEDDITMEEQPHSRETRDTQHQRIVPVSLMETEEKGTVDLGTAIAERHARPKEQAIKLTYKGWPYIVPLVGATFVCCCCPPFVDGHFTFRFFSFGSAMQ